MDRIWYDTDRNNFFAIPTGTELPEGGYLLRSLTAPSRKVDPDAVEEYRISREEATDRLGSGIDDAWGSIVGAVDSLLGKPAAADDDGEPAPSVLPRHLEDVLGLKPGAIVTEPDQIRERLRSAASSVGIKIKVGDEALAEQQVAAEADAEEAETDDLYEDVEPEADEAEGVSDPVRDFFSRPEVTGAIAGLGRALSRLGSQLQDAAEKGRKPPED